MIQGHINKGGSPRKLNDEQERALVAAYASGTDANALAQRFQIDVRTVRRYAGRAGIFRGRAGIFRKPPPPPPPPPHEQQSIDERERARIERLAAYDRRSITGQFLGDPPAGFSALDRRSSS